MLRLSAFIVPLIIFTGFIGLADSTGPYTSVGDLFNNQLANLEKSPRRDRSPYLGGQDFTHCCLLAVNESIEIVDGYAQFRSGQTHLRGDVSDFLRYQFPCTASYNGSRGSPSQVWITYPWCNQNCPGWDLASPKKYFWWIQPLVNFIIPSIVFCLNIPRRRKLQVPDFLFPRNGSTLSKLVALPLKIVAASIIVAIDTLIWLAVVLSMAGPMLISGVYEAVIDVRVLTFLSRKRNISIRDRAQLLYIVLLGNLDECPAWDHMQMITSQLPGLDNWSEFSAEYYVASNSSSRGSKTAATFRIEATQIRLKSIIEAQYSFGSTVGAAIIFFTGGFIYALIEIQSTYGQAGTAHRLAFGMFWMIIPHVAIVSSLLLASNNPSAWEGIASQFPRLDIELQGPLIELSDLTRGNNLHSISVPSGLMPKSLPRTTSVLYRPNFESIYLPAWLWNRGTNKAMWLSRLALTNPALSSVRTEIIGLSAMQWLGSCIVPTAFLLIIPAFLGGMISYTTPTVGIGCRSGTIAIYASSQTLLTILWLIDTAIWKKDVEREITPLGSRHRNLTLRKIPWYFMMLVGLISTFFTSIIGTLFTFMNVYVNCICQFSVSTWLDLSNSNNEVYMGNNSFEKVANAKTYWFPGGMAATAFLVTAAYLGWWYQRRLRALFRDLVEGLGKDNFLERPGEQNAHQTNSLTSAHSRAYSI